MATPREYGVTRAGGEYPASAQNPERMPPKELGRHRWIATAAYTLTPSQAAAADNGARVTLGPDLLLLLAVGCVDCEQPYEACRLDPCPAGDEWSR